MLHQVQQEPAAQAWARVEAVVQEDEEEGSNGEV
jgi:hypothetical protein